MNKQKDINKEPAVLVVGGKFLYNVHNVCFTPNVIKKDFSNIGEITIKTAKTPSGSWIYGYSCTFNIPEFHSCSSPCSLVSYMYRLDFQTEEAAIYKAYKTIQELIDRRNLKVLPSVEKYIKSQLEKYDTRQITLF